MKITKIISILFVFAICAFGLPGCNKQFIDCELPIPIYNIVTTQVNDTIIISHNQIYHDLENDFRLQIDSVLNDSRCPIDVQCIWEGNAAVRFDLIMGDNYHHQFVLNTSSNFQTDTLINNIKFRFVELLPYPNSSLSIAQSNYTIKLMTDKQ